MVCENNKDTDKDTVEEQNGWKWNMGAHKIWLWVEDGYAGSWYVDRVGVGQGKNSMKWSEVEMAKMC